jgi:hypothetical protein
MLLFLTACLYDRDRFLELSKGFDDQDQDGWIAMHDCNDQNPSIFPEADEICDGIDQNCDNIPDNNATSAPTWFADQDDDGFGDDTNPIHECEAPTGYIAQGGDCDDTDETRFPGATEVPYDTLDQDCDGFDLTDVDGDGHEAIEAGGDDCDDENTNIPGEEIAYDGVDQDCDGTDLTDVDGDGSDAPEDCNDTDPSIYPDADETWENGFTDNDCDGAQEDILLEFGAQAWVGESAGGQAGRRISRLGDVTNDGQEEFLVGAVFESSIYNLGGAIYRVGMGGGGDLDTQPALRPAGEAWFLGSGLDGGADVDGDGSPELLVSATGYDQGTGGVWLLSGAMLAVSQTLTSLPSVQGDVVGAYAGSGLRFVGDVTGDGLEDIAVSAPYTSANGLAGAGLVGIFTAANLGEYRLSEADIVIEGAYENATLGNMIDPTGDIDGDGIQDYMLSAENGDIATILAGGSQPEDHQDAIFRLTGTTGAVGMVGDINGDGQRDLSCIINANEIHFFTTLFATPMRSVDDPSARVYSEGVTYIFQVLDLGDRDLDGKDETLIPFMYDETYQTSVLTIIPGSSLTYGTRMSYLDTQLRAVSVRPYGTYGYRAAHVGDTDGDGLEEILLGGYADPANGTEAGGALTIPLPY